MSKKSASAKPAHDAQKHMSEHPEISVLHSNIKDACAHLKAGSPEDALSTCDSALASGTLSAPDHFIAAVLNRKLRKSEASEEMWRAAQESIQSLAGSDLLSRAAFLEAAKLLTEIEASDDVETLYRHLHKIDPKEEKAFIGLLEILTKQGKWQEAVEYADEFRSRKGDTFEALLYLATLFSHFEAEQAVVRFLTLAQERRKNKKQKARLEYLMAANGMPVGDLDQQNMAVAIFDNFAKTYDKTLGEIGNQGPKVIFDAFEELGLPKTKTRRILDAGCGTGLCGSFLRKYASNLIGADISINMLAEAQKKRLYDDVARTDLSELITYPEGPFDMIVCADVLVYFGSLKAVLDNFQCMLSPGGWLLATVEDDPNPDTTVGYQLNKSGRYRHSKAYLLKTLAEAGFPRPKLLNHAPLRTEMLKPVGGSVFAVQKSVLAF